jgi:DNA repair exonuclease SbcCD ATPase subunit
MTADATTRAQVETRALRMLRTGDSLKDVSQATGLTREELEKLQRDFPGPKAVPARCDQAGCKQPAVASAGGWSFCDEHTRAHHAQAQADAEQKAQRIADTLEQIVPPRKATIAELLEDASAHSRATVKNLGARIENDLDRLRALIAEFAEAERAKRQAAAQREKDRAEVARLEKELAVARARLKGKSTSTPAPAAGAACSHGCGRTFTRPAWRTKHEQTCQGPT